MQTAVCDSFVVLTHCILSFSQRGKWVLCSLTAIRGAETFAHESIVSITVLWQLSDSSNAPRMLLCTFFLVASKVWADIFSQTCDSRNQEYQGYIYHYENRSTEMDSSRTGKWMKHFFSLFFFQISPLSTATWKWASPIMIVALVAQDNCLTFAKSVSVSLAYSISFHLKAPSNFGILQCSVTQTEFAMDIDKYKKSDSTANKNLFFITEITHSVIYQRIWTQNDRDSKTNVTCISICYFTPRNSV